MNYYQIQKEIKTNKLKMVCNSDKVFEQLIALEDKYCIDEILPFYDDLISLALSGINLEELDIEHCFNVYKTTLLYIGVRLNEACRCFKSELMKSCNNFVNKNLFTKCSNEKRSKMK